MNVCLLKLYGNMLLLHQGPIYCLISVAHVSISPLAQLSLAPETVDAPVLLGQIKLHAITTMKDVGWYS